MLGALAGCSESPTDTVEYQRIEEVTFAPELGIDLAEFTELQSGIYYNDVVEGTGTPVTWGTTTTITFTGWLTDGRVFAQGTLSFFMGNQQVPQGLEEGLLGARVGGTRRVLVPPERGLGGIEQVHRLGTIVVPAGSVLVYEVVVDGVSGG